MSQPNILERIQENSKSAIDYLKNLPTYNTYVVMVEYEGRWVPVSKKMKPTQDTFAVWILDSYKNADILHSAMSQNYRASIMPLEFWVPEQIEHETRSLNHYK